MILTANPPPAGECYHEQEAFADLLDHLTRSDYAFITPTPATHARVLARHDRQQASNLRDIFGWSLPFERKTLAPAILTALDHVGALVVDGPLLRSAIRVSSLHGNLYLHSAYPTDQEDAVFFGPDSYRFADLIRHELSLQPPKAASHIVDIGTGAGVGAIVAARSCSRARVTMTDINARALRLAVVNAAAAGLTAEVVLGADLEGIDGFIDIALANPPYIVDSAGRDYRDGGAMHGAAVALDMARKAVARLSPGGRLILYTGSAIVAGNDALENALAGLAAAADCTMRYRELDPDVFGEELDAPAYADVERIAVVAAIIERRRVG